MTTPDTSFSSRRSGRQTRANLDAEHKAMMSSVAIHAASNISPYRWPVENLEKVDSSARTFDEEQDLWMVQEQVGAFLSITSFKRKYPDMIRRRIDGEEAKWLLENGMVTEYLIGLGLWAIKAVDVHELMQFDYPEKYEDFLLSLAEKEKRNYDDKTRQYRKHLMAFKRKMTSTYSQKIESGVESANDEKENSTDQAVLSLIPIEIDNNDSEKTIYKIPQHLKNQSKNLLKRTQSASREILKNRMEVFNSYYDDSTNVIQYPKNKKYKLVDPEMTRFDDEFPVKCLPGQYSSYYTKFTPEQLAYLPMNSCLKPGLMKDYKLKLRVGQGQVAQKADSQINSAENNKENDNSTNDLMNLPDIEDLESGVDLKETQFRKHMGVSLIEAHKPEDFEDEPLIEDEATDCLMAQLRKSAFGLNPNNTINTTLDESGFIPSSDNKPVRKALSLDSSGHLDDAQSTADSDTPMICSMCGKDERSGYFVYCSKCRRYGHAECLGLSTKVLAAIRTYEWRCMDCKVCVICCDQDGTVEARDDDDLLFCDYCDRGYHTHCVGLKTVPKGSWSCPDCKKVEEAHFKSVEDYKEGNRIKREKAQQAIEKRKQEKEANNKKSTTSNNNKKSVSTPKNSTPAAANKKYVAKGRSAKDQVANTKNTPSNSKGSGKRGSGKLNTSSANAKATPKGKSRGKK